MINTALHKGLRGQGVTGSGFNSCNHLFVPSLFSSLGVLKCRDIAANAVDDTHIQVTPAIRLIREDLTSLRHRTGDYEGAASRTGFIVCQPQMDTEETDT